MCEFPAGACIVVGGPLSSDTNFNPEFDVNVNFTPDIQNTNKAIGLFDVTQAGVTSATIPLDALIYACENDFNWISQA